MSQNPSSAFDQPRSLSIGLAIAGLICAIAGVCVPIVGPIGLTLGIVALVKASSSPQTHGGKGMALAAIIVGAVSIFTSIVVASFSAGLLLPALGKARDAARQAVTQSNLRQIGLSLNMYANENKGWYPEQGADLQARLANYGMVPQMFESPRAGPGVTDAFIYLPGVHTPFESDTIVMYENPKYVPRGTVSVLRADGIVMPVPVSNLGATLQAAPKPVSKPSPPARQPEDPAPKKGAAAPPSPDRETASDQARVPTVHWSAANADLRMSNRLPGVSFMLGQLKGLATNEQRQINGGTATFVPSDFGLGSIDPKLYVKDIAVPPGHTIIQVRLDQRNVRWGLNSRAAAGVDHSAQACLVGSDDASYPPVGYVHKSQSTKEWKIAFDPEHPIARLSDNGVPQLGAAPSRDELTLIYSIPTGTRLASFRVGDQTLAKFDPPVEAK